MKNVYDFFEENNDLDKLLIILDVSYNFGCSGVELAGCSLYRVMDAFNTHNDAEVTVTTVFKNAADNENKFLTQIAEYPVVIEIGGRGDIALCKLRGDPTISPGQHYVELV